MSTVLYAFRATSDDNLHEQIGIIKTYAENIHEFLAREGVELQVFRTSKGIVYRVLEMGYGLKNQMWHHPKWFPQCNYDDRVDIPKKDEPNKAIAEEIDHLIFTKQYYLEIIVPQKEAKNEPEENTSVGQEN